MNFSATEEFKLHNISARVFFRSNNIHNLVSPCPCGEYQNRVRTCSVTLRLPSSRKFTPERHRTQKIQETRSRKLAQFSSQNAEHLFWRFPKLKNAEQSEITDDMPPPKSKTLRVLLFLSPSSSFPIPFYSQRPSPNLPNSSPMLECGSPSRRMGRLRPRLR